MWTEALSGTVSATLGFTIRYSVSIAWQTRRFVFPTKAPWNQLLSSLRRLNGTDRANKARNRSQLRKLFISTIFWQARSTTNTFYFGSTTHCLLLLQKCSKCHGVSIENVEQYKLDRILNIVKMTQQLDWKAHVEIKKCFLHIIMEIVNTTEQRAFWT